MASRSLSALKRALVRVRALLDLKGDFESGADGLGGMVAQARMAKLLEPYREYLKNPSPSAHAQFLKREGLFFLFLEPCAPPALEDESFFACMERATAMHPISVAVGPETVLYRVERAYAALYRDSREECRKAVGKENFSVVYSTTLAMFGPRIRAENPLSIDPLLLAEEKLWLTNSPYIPTAQRQEAQRQLRRIEASLIATGGGRPPLSATEQPLSRREAVARSKAVSHCLTQYETYRKERTAAEAFELVEDKLNENRRIAPERKPAILSFFRGKAKKLEQTRSGHKV
jgi:hypothetical protein